MTQAPGSAALLADATCYVERSKVREILIGQPDENLYVTELLLSEIDALPIVTAGDFRLAAKPDEEGVRWQSLRSNIQSKIAQLIYYRDHECQLDHARVIAEGRILQANQDLLFIDQALAT